MNRLTAYEKCQIIGKRASDIQNGAKILTDYKGLLNPLLIAEKEYKEGKIPSIDYKNSSRWKKNTD